MPRVLLVGGTSHAGKTSLAENIAANPGWTMRSTDKLAKHPGRPWKSTGSAAPPHVQDHYRTLDVDALIKDVLRHYNSLWPMIESTISEYLENGNAENHSLVIEGSALCPANTLKLRSPHVRSFWLDVCPEVSQHRIYENSDYAHASAEDRYLIDKFLQRTLRFNEVMKTQLKGYEHLIVNQHDSARLSALF